MAGKYIKSADEDQFELDEEAINEISNAEEFADVEITNEDIMDAVEAIDALADAVIEKADGEDKKVDADELLDAVRDMIDDAHDEEVEEIEEEEEIPEEITNSVVRVMVSEEGAVDVEQKPDEVYDSEVDGIECTVFDTCDDLGVGDDFEETADPEKVGDDVLVIGNSASKNFKKGYMRVKSSAGKKAWSAAYKKVKKLVGSSKLTAAHWVIVSALAKKEEEEDKKKKKIECRLVRYIRSNKELKNKFLAFVKSEFDNDVQPDIQPEGQTQADTKPEETAGEGNPGYGEEKNPADGKAGDPDGIGGEGGDPAEDPSIQSDSEGDVVLPEENIVVVDVPLANSVRKIRLQKVRSSANRGYNLYKVMGKRDNSVLNGRVVKSGKTAYAFRSTAHGMLACCAAFVDSGKGTYKPVLNSKNKVVIARGSEAPVFQNYEKIMNAKAIVSARREGFAEGKRIGGKAVLSSGLRRPMVGRRGAAAVRSGLNRKPLDPVRSARRPLDGKALSMEAIRNRRDALLNRKGASRKVVASERSALLKAKMNERKALQSKAELVKMHQAEERQRLFQSSQTFMNEEKVAIKSSNTRNAEALNKLYDGMF